jgi:hypothetical protein
MHDPSTVTLAAPVDAVLLVMTLLGPDASIVTAVVSEFTCQPVVSETRRCVHTPMAVLARTDDADDHTVRWLVLPPSRDGLL